MEIHIIKCPRCPDSPITYATVTEMYTHHLAAHERPLPQRCYDEMGWPHDWDTATMMPPLWRPYEMRQVIYVQLP